MNDVTVIFFGASVAVCLLAIVTFFVVVSYHKAVKRQRELEEELNKLKLEGSTEVNRILLDAQSKAAEIIKNAQIKSQEFMNTSQIFSDDFRSKFQQSLTTGTAQVLSNVTKDISTQIQGEMKSFAQALSQSMQKAVAVAEGELLEYKKHAIEELDSKIFKLVEDTTKKTIAKTLTRSEHEKLVIKALEEAKKQNVF